MSDEEATPPALTGQVIDAVERTMAAETARLECRWWIAEPSLQMWRDFQRRGPLFLKPIARIWGMAAAKGGDNQSLPGWVDFDARRFELDSGHWRVRGEGGQQYAGPPWRRLRKDSGRSEASMQQDPLWLVELLRGTVDAKDLGDEEVRGVGCRHQQLVIDFARAAALSRHGMRQPVTAPQRRLEGSAFEMWGEQHIPVDAWMDTAGLVRRIQVRGFGTNAAMEFYEFGAADN